MNLDDEKYRFTHKQALRNLTLVIFLITLLLCAVLSLIVSEIGNDVYILEGILIGFLNGLLLGILFNKLFFWIWDPVTLQHMEKGLIPSCGFGCIFPLSLATVVYIGFLSVRTLGFSFQGWLFGWILTSIFVIVGYLFFQVWRSKPKE